MATTQKAPASSLRSSLPDIEARREAARAMGSARSDRKAAAARQNGKLAPPGPGRSPVPLEHLECTCGIGDSLTGHKWNCPRGQAIKRRGLLPAGGTVATKGGDS